MNPQRCTSPSQGYENLSDARYSIPRGYTTPDRRCKSQSVPKQHHADMSVDSSCGCCGHSTPLAAANRNGNIYVRSKRRSCTVALRSLPGCRVVHGNIGDWVDGMPAGAWSDSVSAVAMTLPTAITGRSDARQQYVDRKTSSRSSPVRKERDRGFASSRRLAGTLRPHDRGLLVLPHWRGEKHGRVHHKRLGFRHGGGMGTRP